MHSTDKMITLYDKPVKLAGGVPVALENGGVANAHNANVPGANVPGGRGFRGGPDLCGGRSIARRILDAHNKGSEAGGMKIKFDALISHDITYVGIIQTAKASGMTRFPLPYALTNCHNSLCAVGGTINEDDHAFGLSAAKKYGGVYVPANQAVIHQYAREALGEAGGMVLGSDSHTRYGPLGVMGIGEGGPELVKQLLNNTYDINDPEVALVWLENAPRRGVGPHDIAIALCGALYENGFVKNKVMEFAGPGVPGLSMDFRFGVDVMTTETACLSSVWRTDDGAVSDFYKAHGKGGAYKPLAPEEGAVYDALIRVDLSKAEPMIALPFHPSNAYTIREVNENAADLLRSVEREAESQFGGRLAVKLTDKIADGRVLTDQGIIAGCAGGMYDNIREAAAILDGGSVGDGYFSLSVYPSSMPVNLRLIEDGVQGALLKAGALFKPCFCGPCFGAGDVPANNGFSVRHTTRNFINREGSRPGDGQIAAVALMDARSIAATAKNHGALSSAFETEYDAPAISGAPVFAGEVYERRVYNGYGKPDAEAALVYGPNIADWPAIDPLGENILLGLASVIHDRVTTTDELIPSGEASSYRSNPIKLAGFTLSRRDPQYTGRAGAIRAFEQARKRGETPDEAAGALAAAAKYYGDREGPPVEGALKSIQIASAVFANKPGDGSAREQAASCQRVLGGAANVCFEYATKRYRSNLINWGMLPFTTGAAAPFAAVPGDWIYIPGVRETIASGTGKMSFDALLISGGGVSPLTLYIDALTDEEREIIIEGCLMNYYAAKSKSAAV